MSSPRMVNEHGGIPSALTRALPPVTADAWDWQRGALCRGRPEVFFSPEGERGSLRNRRVALARDMCARCPVQTACAEHAVTVGEPYGVWGGLTEHDRGRDQH